MKHPAQCMEPRVFFFGNFGAYGNIRTFFKALLILLGVCSPFCCGLLIYLFIHRLHRVAVSFEEKWTIDLRGVPGSTKGTVVIFLGGAVVMVAFMVLIELQVRWNPLEGVNSVTSTGQIVPLVVGALSIIRAIGLVVIYVCEDAKRTPTHIDQHADLFMIYLC